MPEGEFVSYSNSKVTVIILYNTEEVSNEEAHRQALNLLRERR